MIDTPARVTQEKTLPAREETRRTHSTSLWSRLGLGGIMLISIVMNFYQLGQTGYANLYYAAGVKSMLTSLHNFFFVSFDPGGFVTIDKPPLGFWLQALSAKIFGFTAFSILLPQALAGVLSVGLLFHLVRRRFGMVAGLLAGLALAISPISVATNRNNTIDSTLTLALLLGAWAVFRAAETGRLRWLLLCAVAIGLGFNIKMMEAYLVVPAYGLLYLLAAPHSIWKRIRHLILAGLLLLTLSLAWMVAVDLTPTSLRPWVGSTQNNSEVSLAVGYNGVERLLGQIGIGGHTSSTTSSTTTSSTSTSTTGVSQTPPTGSAQGGTPPQQGTGGFGGFGTGTAGILRLFEAPLAGQIAWLLPLAILGAVAGILQHRPRLQQDFKQQSVLLWGTWLLTMGAFFSVAGFFHPYYLTVMAPAIAALFGIGTVIMWNDYRRAGWKGLLLPLALLATAAEQIYILSSYPAWRTWLIPVIALSIAGAIVLLVLRFVWRNSLNVKRMRMLIPIACIAILSLTVAPTVWSGVTVLAGAQSLPSAGPTTQQGSFGSMSSTISVDTKLISYLEAHQGNAKYLVATLSSNEADSIILTTNKPVMALGGFSGSDPILTTSQLATLAKNGTIRYFLLSGSGGMGNSQSALTTWITQHCKLVSSSDWQTTSTSASTNGGPGGGSMQLYEYVG